MKIGIVGRKCGMSRVFTDEGTSVPVTVIEVEPNRITQLKSDLHFLNVIWSFNEVYAHVGYYRYASRFSCH